MYLFGISQKKIEKWAIDGNIKKLLGALNCSDAAIRRLAITELGALRSDDILEFCKKHCHAEDQQLRWQITQILGLNGTPEAMKILEDVKSPTDGIVTSLSQKYRYRYRA